jgi:hypothetical protein
MALEKVKTNMHGTGGGRWCSRNEAKTASRKARRKEDKREIAAQR